MVRQEPMQKGAAELAVDLAQQALPKEKVQTAFRGYAGRSPNKTSLTAFLIAIGVATVGLGLRFWPLMVLGVALALVLPALLLSITGEARLVAVTAKNLIVLETKGKSVLGEVDRVPRDAIDVPKGRGAWRRATVGDIDLWVPSRVFGVVVDEITGNAA
jgi:hypothetical protein